MTKVPATDGGLFGTIITALEPGLLALITPYVFPMIPVTRALLKQAAINQYQ